MARKVLPKGNGIAKCHSVRKDGKAGAVEIKSSEGEAYLSGVQRCGSVWMCPVCAPKVLQKRSQQYDQVVEEVKKRGGTALFVTMTCWHSAASSVDANVKLMSGAFGKMLRGREWAGHSGTERERRSKAGKDVSDGYRGELGYVGLARVIETTYGEDNGHHPHVHGMLVFDRKLSDAEILRFEWWLFDRWQAYLKKNGLAAVSRSHGVDVKRWETTENLGHYLTKIAQGWGVGSELTGGEVKEAKHAGHWNPAQLLQRFIVEGRPDDVAQVLRDIYRATKGKKMCYLSPALREWAKLEPEQTDEELANEEVGGGSVVELDKTLYGKLRLMWALADLLTAAEFHGVQGVVDHCAAIGMPVVLVHRDTRGCEDDGQDGRSPPKPIPPLLMFDPLRWRA